MSQDGTTAPGSDRIAIKVWSDYVCPFCMLAEGPLHEATRDLPVDIEWMPFELRPYPKPTLRPEDEYLPAIWERSVYPLARRLGVDITLPTVSPQPYTRLAFEGYQYAAEHGKAAEYTPRMLRAFFQENRDIGQMDVLGEIADELGLDSDAFIQALEAGTYTRAHREALRSADAYRIQVAPTMIVAERHRIEGVANPAQIRKAVLTAQAELAESSGAACSVDGC